MSQAREPDTLALLSEPCHAERAKAPPRVRLVLVIGFSPLAAIAAKRSERILAKLFALIPAETGLIAASLFRSCPRSSSMRPGSSPIRAHRREIAERRSRIRTGERSPDVSRQFEHVGQGRHPRGRGGRLFLTHRSTFFLVGSGHERSREDRSGRDMIFGKYYHVEDGTSLYS